MAYPLSSHRLGTKVLILARAFIFTTAYLLLSLFQYRINRLCPRNRVENRGWNRLRLLSASKGTFKYDLGSEGREGNQDSTISVFNRDADGTLRHFYLGHPWLADNIKVRGIDELNPIWNVMDFTSQGRRK